MQLLSRVLLLFLACNFFLYAENARANGSKQQITSEPSAASNNKPGSTPKESTQNSRVVDIGKESTLVPEATLIQPPKVRPDSSTRDLHTSNKSRDGFADGFSPPTWASWGQVLVAVIGLIFIYRTLKAVETQSNAALNTAESLVASERAYVFAKVKLMAEILPHNERNITTYAHAIFFNHGKTPAIILHMSGAAYIYPEARGGSGWLDSVGPSLSGAWRVTDYAAVSHVVRWS